METTTTLGPSAGPATSSPAGEGADRFLAEIWAALGGPADALDRLAVVGPAAVLPSTFRVTALAASSIAAACLAVAEVAAARDHGPAAAVTVDTRQAAVAFRSERHLQPQGWELPPIWDPIAGDYRCADGWIRLHTNYVHHRDAVTRVLGVAAERDAVAAAVARWTGDELEAAVVAEGGCAARQRTATEWAEHPQGRAVAAEAVVDRRADGDARSAAWLARDPEGRPLGGVRVLDLTRVIAGPVCTRVLAAHGADVLRIDPPGFEEVGALLGETTAGKRRAALDLRSPEGRDRFAELVAGADVLVHGYRPGALDGLGFGAAALRALNPALVVTVHDAYGWSGPWVERRGFDSLVQMSAGITAAGQAATGADRPVPLPCQALDHATGYLGAAATCRALADLARGAGPVTSRLSLAGTARLLASGGLVDDLGVPEPGADEVDRWCEDATTAFGAVRRVPCPGRIEGHPPAWRRPAGPLGIDAPTWAA